MIFSHLIDRQDHEGKTAIIRIEFGQVSGAFGRRLDIARAHRQDHRAPYKLGIIRVRRQDLVNITAGGFPVILALGKMTRQIFAGKTGRLVGQGRRAGGMRFVPAGRFDPGQFVRVTGNAAGGPARNSHQDNRTDKSNNPQIF